ncbi:hypothetical protein HPB48_026640 [Haemaphysalis longicornis]|uniref:Uncharacterized protein n=1 Tax=Haemaphysalis longicornis TaxID=44386 RepID=A0A9J6H1N5_HAELO|nr:hypothetical protein HPB48_026640 [Haemaphysalis longicornis]
MAERGTPKGNLQKPSRHDSIDFCFQSMCRCHGEDGRTLIQRVRYFQRTGRLWGRGELHDGLADVGAVAPE